MTTQELAQKILKLINQADEKIEETNASVRESWQELDLLKEAIRELCENQLEPDERIEQDKP